MNVNLIMWIVTGAAAYLLGAIPTGLLIARAHGVDIRKVGSGNIGATNVYRTIGKGMGLLTFFLDALKGWIPASVFPVMVATYHGGAVPQNLALYAGILAVVGHNWPIYLGFKGGKGVATSAGALLGLVPLAVGIAFIVWVAIFIATRYVSVASMCAACAIVVTGWVHYASRGRLLPVALTLLGALLIWRHRSNIQRLRQGTENRINFGRSKKGDESGGRRTDHG